MAAGCEGAMKIHLIHGARNHFITLIPPAEERREALAVRHLIDAAQDQTGIPPERMKLIFKGKSLTQCGDLNRPLTSCGVRHGSKIMVLGSKVAVENYDPSPAQATPTKCPPVQQRTDDPCQVELGKLDSAQRRMQEEEATLSTLLSQGQQLDTLRVKEPAQLDQLKKGLLTSMESLMRLLESLDTLRFEPSDNDARARRKALVNQIQRYMDECEGMLTHIKQILASRK
ncbi:hypothetical protein ACOMHN_036218 [Nucella lapillus]